MTTATRTKLTALMYIRVSTPSQEVDEQVRMIRQYADEHGIEIIMQYGDYQKRHKADQRRSFQAMLTDIETLKPNMILVQRLDRFGTNGPNQLGEFLEKLKKLKVKLVTVMPQMGSIAILELLFRPIKASRSARLVYDLHLLYQAMVRPRRYCFTTANYRRTVMAHQQYASCIQACVECAQACENCADSCLSEKDVQVMAECIRHDRDCAEICWMAAAYMSRGSQFAAELCRVCAEVCEACGAECKKHKADHCQRCAEACRKCAEECRQMAGASA